MSLLCLNQQVGGCMQGEGLIAAASTTIANGTASSESSGASHGSSADPLTTHSSPGSAYQDSETSTSVGAASSVSPRSEARGTVSGSRALTSGPSSSMSAASGSILDSSAPIPRAREYPGQGPQTSRLLSHCQVAVKR